MCPRGRAVCACGIQRAARIGMVLMLKGRYLPPGLVLSQQLPTGLLRLQQGAPGLENWRLAIGSLKLELQVTLRICARDYRSRMRLYVRTQSCEVRTVLCARPRVVYAS